MTLNKVIDRVRGSNRTISNKEYYKRLSFKAKYISIEKESYKCANGFNITENALKLKVVFRESLETMISL